LEGGGSTPFVWCQIERRNCQLVTSQHKYWPYFHETLVISKPIDSNCSIKVPDQPSTLFMLQSTSALCVDTEDCWGCCLKTRDFVSAFLYFSDKEYTELLTPKLGYIKPENSFLKLQGSGRRTYHARAYNLFKAATFCA
jgi:hypothetical protein